MTAVAVNHGNNSQKTPSQKGLVYHLKEAVYAPDAKRLIAQLNASEARLSFELFSSCIDYLSAYSHPQLQANLASKLQSLASTTAKELLIGKIKDSSLRSVWDKRLSLEQIEAICGTCVQQEVTQDKAIIPQYSSKLQQTSQKAFDYLYRQSGYLGKITQFFIKVITLSYKIDFDKPPKEQWQAQTQMATLRMVVEDVCVVGALVAAYFPSYLAITAVACAALVSFAVLMYVYMRYKLGTPDKLSSLYGTNLNLKAKEYGQQQRTSGRIEEMKQLEEQLSAFTQGPERYVPMILGPPGCGKTQLMQGLALKIVEGQVNEKLLGKQILLINSQSLASGGKYDENEGITNRLEELFRSLKGLEDQFILFFDEAHNLGQKQGGVFGDGTNNLEDLKLKVLESGIQCVFATTQEEYQKSIALNPAIVSRLQKPIVLKSLSDADVIRILKNKPKDPAVNIKSDVYEAILPIAKKLWKIERLKELFEPLIPSLGTLEPQFFEQLIDEGIAPKKLLLRDYFITIPQQDLEQIEALSDQVKAIVTQEGVLNPRIADQVLGSALGYVRAFRPLQLAKAAEEARQAYDAKVCFMQEQRQDNYDRYQQEFQAHSQELSGLKTRKEALASLLDKQQKQVQLLEQLTRQASQAKEKWDELTHLIAQNPQNQQLQKDYLFLTRLTIPHLEKRKKEVLNSFNTDFGEYNEQMIERLVTVDVLKKLYS